MINLLLLEDDPSLGKALKLALELENFKVDWHTSLASAREGMSKSLHHLGLFDVNLPDGSGLDLCREVSQKTEKFPIVILTAQGDEETAVRGLNQGASDFVRKPFSNRELVARLKAVARDLAPAAEQMGVAGLVMDFQNRRAIFKGQLLDLNRRQFDILGYFLRHHDRIVTREMLLSHLGREADIFDRTIDSHVSQLRKVLKQNDQRGIMITSVYGLGYRLEIEA